MVPFATGGGAAVRAASKANEVVDAVKGGSKLLKAGDETADMGVDVVRHFTDDSGKEAISKSGFLKEGTFITRSGDVPKGATPSEIEKFLEIDPGKTRNYERFF